MSLASLAAVTHDSPGPSRLVDNSPWDMGTWEVIIVVFLGGQIVS
jgi:hypothetical protein